MKDPNLPRDKNGDVTKSSAGFGARPRYTPPQVGWRDRQQQCAHTLPGPIRCQEAVSRWSSMCLKHASSTPVRSAYSRALAGLGPKYEAHRDDKNLTDSREQIAVFKTYLTWLMEKAGEDEEKIIPLLNRLDQLDAMINRYQAAEQARAAVWNANDIRAFGLALGQLVNRMIRDERDKQSLLDGLKNLMSGVDIFSLAAGNVIDLEVNAEAFGE